MRGVAIIQARMGSTRLPGKVLKPFGEKAVLEHVCRRAAAAGNVCVAIPEGDTELGDWLDSRGVWFAGQVYRGPEQDVLGRYWGAALQSEADVIVRITADCPLVDPDAIRHVIARSVASDTYCRTDLQFPRGQDVEAFPIRLLAEAHWRAGRDEREHVTTWMQRGDPPLKRSTPRMRWTLDTEEDYAWFCRLAQHVNTEPPHPTTEEVLDYIAKTGDVLYEPEA